MTLAYVFWHWKQASVDRAEYERGQAAAPSAALDFLAWGSFVSARLPGFRVRRDHERSCWN